MLDDRIQFAQLAAEDRLRQLRQQAMTRETKRIFQLSPRRPVRGGAR